MSFYIATDGTAHYNPSPFNFSNNGPYAPSAPPLEEIEETENLYPQMPLDTEIVNQFKGRANQVYAEVYPDLMNVQALPSIDLNDHRIQTLKDIESSSKKGFICALLKLMIKALRVIGKLALGFAVASSIASVAAILAGVPVPLVIIIAYPLVISLVLGNLTCKVAAHGLMCLKQKWTARSFYNQMEDQRDIIEPLKAWIQKKNDMPAIEQRLQKAAEEIVSIQETVGDPTESQSQLLCLQSLRQKITTCVSATERLEREDSMPLLTHYLDR